MALCFFTKFIYPKKIMHIFYSLQWYISFSNTSRKTYRGKPNSKCNNLCGINCNKWILYIILFIWKIQIINNVIKIIPYNIGVTCLFTSLCHIIYSVISNPKVASTHLELRDYEYTVTTTFGVNLILNVFQPDN